MRMKVWAGIYVFTAALTFFATDNYAGKFKYSGGPVANGGSISGVVRYDGPPKDVSIPVMKEKNGDTCSKHPDTVDGVRVDHKISSANGLLQGAVVFIEHIESGKEWVKKAAGQGAGKKSFTGFHFRDCDIFPKITVVRKTAKGEQEGNLTVTSHDPEVLHNPIGYLVVGANRKILFNKPLSDKGAVVDATNSLKRLKKKKAYHLLLQCGQHNYVEADARIVWNPYYFVTGADGSFKLEQIPAGTYQVTAWHPYAGKLSQRVTVSGGADTPADFEIQ